MGVEILRPTSTPVPHTTGSIPSPSIVGGGGVLGDQSDASYVTVSWRQTPFQGNWVDATQPAMVGDPAGVTSVVAHARVSSATAGNPTLRWLNSTVPFGNPILYADADLAIAGGEGVVEVSAVVADAATGGYGISNWTMAEIASYLAGSDVYVEVGNSAGVDADMTVYDVWLEVISLSPCFQTLAGAGVGAGVASLSSPAFAVLDTYGSGPVLDLTIGFTATSMTAPKLVYAGVWGGWDGSSVSTDLAVTVDFPIVDDGAPHAYTHTFTDAELGETLTAIRDALSDPSSPAALRFEVSSGSATITDTWLQVGHKCYVLAPPCQIYPRDDNQGAGSAAVWPPPSNQRPGSYY